MEDVSYKHKGDSTHPGNRTKLVNTPTSIASIPTKMTGNPEHVNYTDRIEFNKPPSPESLDHDIPEVVRRYSHIKEAPTDETTTSQAKKYKDTIRRRNVNNLNKIRKLKSSLANPVSAFGPRSPSPGSLSRATTMPLDCSIDLKYSDDLRTKVSVRSLTKQGRKVVDLAQYDKYARKGLKTLPSVFNSPKIQNGKRTNEVTYAYQIKRSQIANNQSTPGSHTTEDDHRFLSKHGHTESRDSGIVCNGEKSSKLRRSQKDNTFSSKGFNEKSSDNQTSNWKGHETECVTSISQSEGSVTVKDAHVTLPSISPPLTFRG